MKTMRFFLALFLLTSPVLAQTPPQKVPAAVAPGKTATTKPEPAKVAPAKVAPTTQPKKIVKEVTLEPPPAAKMPP